ncbi:MAG: ATP-binding protein [Candidatus Freyarchaeota archaeon]|nr:ATP-binding protein [Candidatus Jordarchaeia archaeon]
MQPVGTVICTDRGPTTSEFTFVVTSPEIVPVRRGQLVQLKTEDGLMLAVVQEVMMTNRFYYHAEAVKELERSGRMLSSIFPCDRWDMLIATAKPIGVLREEGFDKITFPPSPGEKVYLAERNVLSRFFGFDEENGLEIGFMRYHDVPVKLNMTRLLQKHLAILAMSGSGKSYLATVLLEEVLAREKSEGRIFTLVVDVHGEYTALSQYGGWELAYTVSVIKGSYVQFATPILTERQLAMFQPDMSPVQVRELGRLLSEVRKAREDSYSLSDVISFLEGDEKVNPRTKEALLGWLYELDETQLFGVDENPHLPDVAKPGRAVVLDLSDILSLRKKQMIVAYILQRLFDLRRRSLIPPSLVILEEAHQFCPEAKQELALSKSVIEAIAREGRKFHFSLCLISQRPVRLATSVLSQANTHIILRVTNPNDLKAIELSSEMITRETLGMIADLPVGEALIVGSAVNAPLFIKVRRKKASSSIYEETMEEAAKRFEAGSTHQPA